MKKKTVSNQHKVDCLQYFYKMLVMICFYKKFKILGVRLIAIKDYKKLYLLFQLSFVKMFNKSA